MRCTNRWFIVSLITALAPSLLAHPSAAQSQASSDPPLPRPSASAAPLVMKLLTVDMRVGADGLYTQRVHWELTPTNDSAASRAGQQAVSYSAALEDVQIIEAYTLKPDGRRLAVEPSQIFDQSPQGALQFPLFSDERRKVIVFPSVAANDTIALTYLKRALKPEFPGQFMSFDMFPRAIAWNEVRERIVTPRGFPLTVEAHGVEFQRVTGQNEVTYAWHFSAPDPLTADIAAVSPYDREPRLFASSFKSYADLGRAYAEPLAPRLP